MRGTGAVRLIDGEFDVPPCLAAAIADRRMAGQAVDRWRATGGGFVDGFGANSLLVVDPAGAARISEVGPAIAVAFGLAAGMYLNGRDGMTAEIRAACELIAVEPRPVSFEASLLGHGAAVLLVRGVALPVHARPGTCPHLVQVVVNWREVLDWASMTRLRRELGAELGFQGQKRSKIDPFSIKAGV